MRSHLTFPPSLPPSLQVDAIGGSRTGGDETGSDNEVQRTMLQIVTELDGFDPRGNIKVSREGRRGKGSNHPTANS